MDFSHFLTAPSILVQRSGAMGDVVWTTPVFKEMRSVGYAGNIVVATHYPEVFRNNPDITWVVNPDGVKDIPRSTETWNMDWSYERARKKHILEAYCDVIGLNYSSIARDNPILYPDADDLRWADGTVNRLCCEGARGIVVIHAAAKSPDRIWQFTKWEALTTWLLSIGRVVVFVGTDGDFHPKPRNNVVDLVGCTTLLRTAALIEFADIFIGPDSGIANVAFSTNTPALVLYGMADPSTRLPTSSALIHHGVTADKSDCPCLGCLEHLPVTAPPLCSSTRKKMRAPCMDLLSVHSVIVEAEHLLAKRALRCQQISTSV